MTPKRNHISLKEAAEISGYSPDYLGQLIRSGKLKGEQVYLNVAWMTTEDALRDYMEQKGRKGVVSNSSPLTSFGRDVFSLRFLESAYAFAGWATIGVLALFVLSLGYVFSVTIDRQIEEQAVRSITYHE